MSIVLVVIGSDGACCVAEREGEAHAFIGDILEQRRMGLRIVAGACAIEQQHLIGFLGGRAAQVQL